MVTKFRKISRHRATRADPSATTRRWAKRALWAAALFSFGMAVSPRPPDLGGPPSYRIEHVLAFVVLASLSRFAYPAARTTTLVIWLGAFGALIELVQAIPLLGRDSDVLDWLADVFTSAAVLFLLPRPRN